MIRSVTTQKNHYEVGLMVGNDTLHEIKQEDVFLNGDPFAHWVGYNRKGTILFRVNCSIPSEVIYMIDYVKKKIERD